MKDLNFFEPYIEKKEFKIDREVIMFFVSIIFVFSIIIYSISNQVKISRLTKKDSKLKGQVENQNIIEKVEDLQSQENDINYLKGKIEHLNMVDEYIVESDMINEYLLQTITSRTPENIFLNSVDIDTSSISIQGTSRDKYSIAEFEHSIKNTEGFIETFISNIYLDNGYYNFSLNIKLRDEDDNDYGNENETETEEVQTEEGNTTDEE